MGLSAAYRAGKEGFDVTLFDKHILPARNASSIAGGMLAPFSEIEALPDLFIEAGLDAINKWQEILGDSKFSCLQMNGSLLLAHKEDVHMLDRFEQYLSRHPENWEKADKHKINELEPMLGDRFSRAIYISREGNLDPDKTLRFLIGALKTLGVRVTEQEAYPRQISDHYDYVLDCRGFVEGLDPAMRGIKGEILLLENKEFELQRPVRMMHPRYPLYIIPRGEGVFAVGASIIENADEGDNSVLLRSAMELMSAAYSLHPSFAEAKILDMSSAVRPAYMDNLPRIKIDETNVIGCNGLFRHGYLFSPIMADITTSYIKNKTYHKYYDIFVETEGKGKKKYG